MTRLTDLKFDVDFLFRLHRRGFTARNTDEDIGEPLTHQVAVHHHMPPYKRQSGVAMSQAAMKAAHVTEATKSKANVIENIL